jgi:hypothetical protein
VILSQSASPLQSQAAVAIADKVACPKCKITDTVLATISTSKGGYVVGDQPLQVQVDGHGRYWVTTESQPTAIFDATGRYLRDVGRLGRGPGEFQRAAFMTPMGDSILVHDLRASRFAILNADLREVQTIPVTDRLIGLTWLGKRSFVGSGLVRTPEHGGWQLHAITAALPAAVITKSFGLGDGSFTPGAFDVPYQWNIASARGGFWTADQVRFRLASWTADGKVNRVLEREAEWFVPSESITAGGRAKPPTTFVNGVAEDEAGLLWVFVKVPKQNWRELWRAPGATAPGRQEVRPPIDLNALWETRIEVIDPKAARLIATLTTPASFISAMPDRRSAWYVDTPSGDSEIRIMRLTLQR